MQSPVKKIYVTQPFGVNPASYGGLSATVPFTWATDDSMSLDVTYFI